MTDSIMRKLTRLEQRFQELRDRVEVGGNLVVITSYDSFPERTSESNMWGGIFKMVDADTLSNGNPVNFTVGVGRLFLSLNAGADFTGTMTITGTSVNPATGAETPADTEVITVDTLTTDSSTTDGNGNIKHGFTDAYISSKVWTNATTISTTDINISDIDVYDIAAIQYNGEENMSVTSFGCSLFCTSVNAEFDAYLYHISTHEQKTDMILVADVHVGTNGPAAVADRYYRLSRSSLGEPVDGSDEGIFVDVFYANSPAYIEDVTVYVNAYQN